ncbi:hypothetical protein [Dyella ginsengisoli]|uniref:hypothetical protein n=1 Tax=Dyella ginsengisoli TaxID=363848 RepID=UPI000348A13F|nr:hypothetical protein [Dyella ginsengisoli]
MTTRSRRASAGFGWLTRGFSAGFRHPKPLWGGAAILLAAVVLPSLVTLPIRLHAIHAGVPVSPMTSVAWTALSMLIGLLVIPLYGGYLQVIDAAEYSRAARIRDIFSPYRDGSALRLIGFGLAALLIYVAMFALLLVAAGGGLLHWYMQALTMQAQQLPLPHGLGLFVALGAVFFLFFTGFYAIGLGQVALSRRGVFASIGDGLVGAVKNVLPLLAYALGGLLALIGVAIVLIFVVMVAVLLGKLVGAWLMLVISIPLYIAFMMTIFMAMFGVSYHLWRDVCGTDDAPALPEPATA